MDSLLFLAHRLPYPPNKGDKVRSYHFLQHLAKRYQVFLGTFIDDPSDWEHVDVLRTICADVHVEPLVPWWNSVRSATCFLSGEPLTLPYFRSQGLRDWVQEVVEREHTTRAFAFSSPMAQYVIDQPKLRCFVDFVDMDSAKWDDYAQRRQWPVSALYQREACHLLAYERDIATRAEATIFVTEEETEQFRKEAPDCVGRVMTIRNGVDSVYFSPSSDFKSPFASDERPIVFTGAMDYWPNVDAVVWFAREVLPEIRKQESSARFYVVGMKPTSAVRSLASDSATIVTGRVADVRPYLQHACVVVAPLRVARGLQNKVLEAMAMAKPVVVTAATAASLPVRQGIDLQIASDAHGFAEKVLEVMDAERGERMGRAARSRVLSDYVWPASLELLDRLLEPASGKPELPPVAGSTADYAMSAK